MWVHIFLQVLTPDSCRILAISAPTKSHTIPLSRQSIQTYQKNHFFSQFAWHISRGALFELHAEFVNLKFSRLQISYGKQNFAYSTRQQYPIKFDHWFRVDDHLLVWSCDNSSGENWAMSYRGGFFPAAPGKRVASSLDAKDSSRLNGMRHTLRKLQVKVSFDKNIDDVPRMRR
jgi:hypothetical protein